MPKITGESVTAKEWNGSLGSGPVAGRYLNPGVGSVTSNLTMANGMLTVLPVVSPGFAADALRINVPTAGAAGSTARLGVYGSTDDGHPGALLVDAGTVATDTTGEKTIVLGTNLTVPIGLIWLACLAETPGAVASLSVSPSGTGNVPGAALQFISTHSWSGVSHSGLQVTGQASPLPATWPAGSVTTRFAPVVLLRSA